MDQDLNPGSLPDMDGGQSSGDGGQSNQSGVSIKDVLSTTLGRTYESDEAALKAVKDLNSYVGRKVEDAVRHAANDPLFADDLRKMLGTQPASANKEPNDVDTSKFISKDQYEQDMFFSKNPGYEPYRDLLKGLSVANNVSLVEAAKLDTFKTVYEKATAYDQVQKSKSVLETNPRLGHVTDKLSKARENLAAGNDIAAKDDAVAAVLEAYKL